MATKMINEPLTIPVLVALGTIMQAAQGNLKITWLGKNENIEVGTARSIGDQHGMFLRGDLDVRDAYLRITSVTGFEHFIPIMDVVGMVQRGEFALDS